MVVVDGGHFIAAVVPIYIGRVFSHGYTIFHCISNLHTDYN